MEHPRVTVVGAGASGMAAAISAAVSGAHVCLLEAAAKPGRSILASGNGRCNFANADLAPERYNDPSFVAEAMGDDPLGAILDFFGHLGLWYRTDAEGRLFPRSRAASSVLDVLLAGARERGVELELASRAVGVARAADGSWEVGLESGRTVRSDALVWAAGGGSAGIPASCLGLPRTEERTALCPLACSPKPPRELDGVRASCAVELRDGRSTVDRQEGEVLFRRFGLSGIVVFDLSRLARPGDVLALDLVPDLSADELHGVLERRRHDLAPRLAGTDGMLPFLDGALHPRIARHLMGLACGADGSRPLDPGRLAGLLKGWEFAVVGPAESGAAQVTQGGLALDAFDPSDLAARGLPGFHACGEALDVDGACGGFNLAWAWVSGMVAGVAAART